MNDPDVCRLLGETPALAALIGEAADQLVHFFPDARLWLKMLRDPEFGDAEELFLGVYTSLPDDQADKALKRFDEEWWVQNVRRAAGLLCIDLAYE